MLCTSGSASTNSTQETCSTVDHAGLTAAAWQHEITIDHVQITDELSALKCLRNKRGNYLSDLSDLWKNWSERAI